MHEKALKGDTTENLYAINLPVRSGSADNMLGLMSMFLWALLSNRVFIKYQSPLLPMIELAYEPATFNWLASHNPIERQANCLFPLFDNETEGTVKVCDPSPVKVLSTDTRLSRPTTARVLDWMQEFYHGDMSKQPSDSYQHELLLTLSAKGFMYQIFNNPHHNETLKSWGLTQNTIFGCIFHYLLRPRSSVCKKDIAGSVPCHVVTSHPSSHASAAIV
jgi:hypothetical protein